MPFTGVNYRLLLIGLAVVVVGFMLMSRRWQRRSEQLR
jgi:hypothetical protein